MGRISRELPAHFKRAGKQPILAKLRSKKKGRSAGNPQGVKDIQELVDSGMDPLHAAYVWAQNFASLFTEGVATLDEFDPYYQIVTQAEDEYLPGGPPMSPLTTSYFSTWAMFDVRFGPDLETIGTCLLETGPIIGVDTTMIEIVGRFQESRMGIYEHLGMNGSHQMLRELVTGKEFKCHVSSEYRGKAGELWYARLCPPLFDLVDYHLVFTTPYILINTTREAWTAYLKKSIIGGTDQAQALHDFLKFGPNPNHWNEFISQAYHHHSFEAIFLAGLPDVRTSLPHGRLSKET